jgi:hypothetical protein
MKRLFGFQENADRERGRRKLEPCLDDALCRSADMITKQIELEQGLTATRMTWNLTFQGFTIAGFALVATAESSTPSRATVQILICLVSIAIAFATLMGVWASQAQRNYLKALWLENGLSRFFPEPFSMSSGSRWGRLPALIMCSVLIFLWAVLAPIAAWKLSVDPSEPLKIEIVKR